MIEQEIYSRDTDPTPIQCEECGWRGRIMDLIHTYHPTNDDVEPADECPDCGSDNWFEV